MKSIHKLALTAALLAGVSVLSAARFDDAQPEPVDVAVALDQPVGPLELRGQDFPSVLQAIGDQAGVPIIAEDAAIDLLPAGSRTRLKDVAIEDGPALRTVLAELLSPLGLSFEIRDDAIMVVPTAPLKRMVRRASWEDLELMRQLSTEYTQENFARFKIQYRITSKVNAPAMLADQMARAGQGTIAQVLETATGALGWVWLPNGDHIVIRTAEAQIANLMAQRISKRYENTPLARILVDLADMAETPITFEPGMMLKLPPQTANGYTLLLDNATIRQATQLISAETGLVFDIKRDGLFVRLAENAADGAPARRSAFVGKITIPSKDGSFQYEFLLREDELPEDILSYRRQIVDEYIQKMRHDMAEDNTIRNAPTGNAGR